MIEEQEIQEDKDISSSIASSTECPASVQSEFVSVPAEPSNQQIYETESPKPKKAAGEAFQDLKNSVIGMDFKLDEISQFVHLAKNKLTCEADEYISQGKLKVLESFFELHDMLFNRVMAMEAGSLEPDSFSIELIEYVTDILEKHGVEVIIPQPGEYFDMNYMESLRATPARFWRKPNTVANVEKCGYSIQDGTNRKILRPARVNVYRKQSK